MKNKFNCLEKMHRGAEAVRRETEGMSLKEKVKYWQKQNEIFKKRLQSIKHIKSSKTTVTK